MKNSRSPVSFLLAAGTAAVLAACGGGSGAPVSASPAAATAPAPAPVSTPAPPAALTPAPPLEPTPTSVGQSTVSGTVTGFGSVIVDGVRVDDSAVAAGRELDDGRIERVELKLGQHVEIEHNGQLLATRVRVVSEAEGMVSAVNPATGTLTVAGQASSVNTDPARGPVTIFDGYASLAAVQINDRVEVHGIIKTDAAGKVSLQATRIEKASAIALTADRVHGIASNLSTSTQTFQLAGLLIDYSAARVLPAGAVIANGNEVHVIIPLGTVAGSAAVKASVIRLSDHKAKVGAKDSELGGLVSALDANAKTLVVNGVRVDASAASFERAGKSFADLGLNAYIVVKGSYAADGTLKAAMIVLRGAERAEEGEIELHGSITSFSSVASFAVRNVRVDATGVKLDLASCGTAQLANDLQVEVKGLLSTSGQVKASAIKCEKANDAGAVISRVGTASSVNATARTFLLTTSTETVPVDWSDLTLFRDLDANTLSGKKVEVEGVSLGGVLHAAKIAIEKD